MERFGRIKGSVVITWVLILALTSALYGASPSDRCLLIEVQVSGRDDIQKLANMGLDIWEYRESGLIIQVTDDERKQITESGFTVETIAEDADEYIERITQEQISLFAGPSSAKYHSHDEVITELIALEDSGIAKTYIIGGTHEGRDIWAVRISDNPSEDEGEPGALFMGGQHAREWIGIEVPLYIAQFEFLFNRRHKNRWNRTLDVLQTAFQMDPAGAADLLARVQSAQFAEVCPVAG